MLRPDSCGGDTLTPALLSSCVIRGPWGHPGELRPAFPGTWAGTSCINLIHWSWRPAGLTSTLHMRKPQCRTAFAGNRRDVLGLQLGLV